MLEILIIIGFCVGCQIGMSKMQTNQKTIEYKSLIEYFLQ